MYNDSVTFTVDQPSLIHGGQQLDQIFVEVWALRGHLVVWYLLEI